MCGSFHSESQGSPELCQLPAEDREVALIEGVSLMCQSGVESLESVDTEVGENWKGL